MLVQIEIDIETLNDIKERIKKSPKNWTEAIDEFVEEFDKAKLRTTKELGTYAPCYMVWSKTYASK